jgi:D-sedoheptulose 7-phosphate isomerase
MLDRKRGIAGYIAGLEAAIRDIPIDDVDLVIQTLYAAYASGHDIFIAGNGGSAATASHMACDLVKAAPEGKRIRATALTDNVAVLSAIGNDLGYERIFAEQLMALADEGDVLVAISASGSSPNIVEAVQTARLLRLRTVGLLGFGGGRVKDLVDVHVLVESNEYGHVEDIHLVLNHIIASGLRLMAQARVEV